MSAHLKILAIILGVSDAVKWETVFGSTNDKVSGNGLYISQSLLHHGQGKIKNLFGSNLLTVR
jgi:hypothetical protein